MIGSKQLRNALTVAQLHTLLIEGKFWIFQRPSLIFVNSYTNQLCYAGPPPDEVRMERMSHVPSLKSDSKIIHKMGRTETEPNETSESKALNKISKSIF